MAEPELEEGEACYYQDDDSNIDPDTALSYIDEKLQNVLGHFQRDFEGGVSAENLGAKFGGYGSFLPAQERSPSVRSGSKTLQRAQIHNVQKSTTNQRVEGVPKNSLVCSDVPASLKHVNSSLEMHLNDPKFTSADGLGKTDPCLLPAAQAAAIVPAKDKPPSTKPGNQTKQKKIRLRIKVGSDCPAQKNAAIYSGLGLTSPSSPVGHSPNDSHGEPSKSSETLGESPANILQSMTSFSAKRLSPLHASLLQLKSKKNTDSNSNSLIPTTVHQKDYAETVDNSTSKASKEIKRKLVGGIEAFKETNHRFGVNNEYRTQSTAKKQTKIDTQEEIQCNSGGLKLKMLSAPACNTSVSSKGAAKTIKARREAGKDVPPKKRDLSKDWVKERLIFSGGVNEESVMMMHGNDGAKYEQQASKSGLVEKIGRQVRNFEKDISDNLRGVGRTKGDRVATFSEARPSVSKRKSDSMNHPKQKAALSCTQNELETIGTLEGSRKISLEGKRKLKGSQHNRELTSNLVNERSRSDVHVLENKKLAQKDVVKLPASSEYILDLRSRHKVSRMDQPGRPLRDTVAYDQNIEMVKEKDATSDIACSKGHPPVLPVDEWVQCDSCQTWRLLPYGTISDQLPEKWLCSMLNWLPGMNCCEFSEDETTNALLAMYQPVVPLLESNNNFQSHANDITSGAASTDVPNLNQNLGIDTMLDQGEKKLKAKEISTAGSNSGVIQNSILTMNSRRKMKNRYFNDMKNPLPKSSLINECTTQHPDNLSDWHVDRYACKQKVENQIDDGPTKPKKLRLKEPDQNRHNTSMKVMTKDEVSDDHKNSENSRNHGRMCLSSSSGLPTRIMGNNLEKEQHYPKDKRPEPKDRSQPEVKTLRDATPGILNSGSMEMKKYNEKHGMKRKSKDRQDNQNNLVTFHNEGNSLLDDIVSHKELGCNDYRKDKKPRVSMTEGHESTASRGDEKLDKKGKVTRIFLSGSRDSSSARNKQQKLKSDSSQINLDDIVSPKKELGSEQLSNAIASSSSKVSDSRERISYKEVKASPVGSVSSSPTRTSNVNKVSSVRRGSLGKHQIVCKEEAPGVFQAESGLYHLQEFCDHDVSGEADSSVKPLFDSKSKRVLTSDEDTLTQRRRCLADVHFSGQCQSVERMNTTHERKNGTCIQKSGKDSSLLPEDRGKCSYNAQNVNLKSSDPLCDQEFNLENDRDIVRRPSEYSQREIQLKMSEHNGPNTMSGGLCSLGGRAVLEQHSNGETAIPRNSTRLELSDGKTQVHSHHSARQEMHTRVPKPLSVSLKGSGLDVSSVDGCSNVSKGLQQPGNSVHQNGTHHSLVHCVADQSLCRDTNVLKPVKGYISSHAADVLRESEHLKGHADHLKNSGFKFDSDMANFQAALKSLFGASLLENSTTTNGSTGCGEMTHIQIYGSSAKIFETCAHDFEKHEELSAAALAYKCAEVAYMRIVYCKSITTNRDRLELQRSLQMVPQGESPSSSASDVDSLYNQVTEDNSTLSRGLVSNGASDAIVVRNRSNIIRLLNFTNDMNLAMEATRKSLIAFEAAKKNLEKANNGGGVAVRRVIDFSFHDIEEFIRLAKLANEAICSGHI